MATTKQKTTLNTTTTTTTSKTTKECKINIRHIIVKKANLEEQIIKSTKDDVIIHVHGNTTFKDVLDQVQKKMFVLYFYSNYNENDEQDENVDDYSNNDKSKYNICHSYPRPQCVQNNIHPYIK